MRTLNGRIAALRSRLAGEQEGLTLVELLVALGILFVSLLALARTATVAFTDTALGRQRQTANQIANQLLEEARGLPYDTLEKGMETSDLGGDANIVSCSGVYRYKTCTGEEIVHTDVTAPEPAISPLVPHTDTIDIAHGSHTKTYSYNTYVTEAADAPAEGAYRVIALVSWTGAARGGVSTTVESQTLVYSPSGCIDTDTHPYGAPCQPYYYGHGSAGGGSFTTTGSVSGVSFDSMGGALAEESADLQVEQIARVLGSVALPGISRVVGGVQTSTGETSNSFADSDPGTATGVYSAPAALGPQAPASLTATGGGNTLSVASGSGSQGSTKSTTAAGGANACNSQLDSKPCGYATVTPSGSLTHSLTVGGLVGSADLVTVGSSGTATTVYGRRFIGSGDGLVRETVNMTVPEIRLGDLPSGVGEPAGWLGYWVRLTGLTASAQADAGEGTTAPTVSITSGQIQAWNGSGYTTTAIDTTGGAITISNVDHTYESDEDVVQVQISGTLTREASTTSENISSGSIRTEASAEIGSPLTGAMSYRVIHNGQTVVDLNITINAGGVEAATDYSPAPTGA
jgi:type II secretory pathway pseudopilin PulG